MAYIGKQPVVGNFVKLDAITTSATATYNLLNGGVAYFPQTANNCIVSLNGVIQSPTSAYTISGSTIVFSDALTASDSIDFILVLGDVLSIGTPSDGTVGFAKVTSNLITGATAETSIAGGDSVLIYDDSASALRKMTRTNFVSGIGGVNTPIFLIKQTTATSTTNSITTKVNLDNAVIDTASGLDTTNKRWVVPSGQGGKYFITAKLRWDSQSDWDNSSFYIYKNGGSIVSNYGRNEYYDGLTMSFIVSLVATDYLELYGRQVSGGSLDISTDDSGVQTFLAGYKLIE